jgi:deuterolysin
LILILICHEVTPLYDYASAGKGRFDFIPNTSFKVSDRSSVEATAAPVTVEITDDVFKRELKAKHSSHSNLNKRSVVTCADAAKGSFIQSSYIESKELANVALHSLAGGPTSVSNAYFSTNPVGSITDILGAVATESDDSRTLSCTDDFDVCDGNVIAYTLIATTNVRFSQTFHLHTFC